MNWHKSLPPAESPVPCGGRTHTVRWEAGELNLPAHPDAEAELVLGALGGDKPACLTLAETWERHAGDLAVLMAGPRSADDHVTVTWEQVSEQWAHRPGPAVGGDDFARQAKERAELLQLLALGPEFQFRLSGTVAAAWAARERAGERAERSPELTAALTGRFAPVAAEWLGIDPDAVTITPHEGPGWGALSVSGGGELTGALPIGWLAGVWACGLAIADGHLVVSVTGPGYPRAEVLALPEPGASPVPREVNR